MPRSFLLNDTGNEDIEVLEHEVTEIGVGLTKECKIITAGIVLQHVPTVGISFLTDALFGIGDQTSDEARLVLMRCDELGRDDGFLFHLVSVFRHLDADAFLCFGALFGFTPTLKLRQFVSCAVTQFPNLKLKLIQRVRREVDSDEVFLFVESFDSVPTRYNGQIGVLDFDRIVKVSKEREGIVLLICLPFVTVVHEQVETGLTVFV